jgi:hypothetical protein
MKKILLLVLFLNVWVMIQPAVAEKGLTGREIMLRVDDRPDGDDRKSLMRMILINKRGHKRERLILSYSRDYGKDTKNIMYFKIPADVKGTGFLSWEYDDPSKDDDRWLYLPALKKVRRISGSSKNDYFMGSDFTYDDMGGRSGDEDNHTLIKEESVGQKSCWVIQSVPIKKDYMYSKVIHWIDKESYFSVKAEFYDRSGNLLKVLKLLDIRKQDGFWTAFKWLMDNHQKKHQTLLELESMEYNLGINESMFRVSTLERGHLK